MSHSNPIARHCIPQKQTHQIARLLDRLRRTWRLACGDAPEPSAVVIDSRSCRSAPSCFARGIDGGKKVRGVKIQIAVEKYGIPLAIDVAPANRHDTKAIIPVLRTLADGGSRVRRSGISATGVTGWPKPVRRSASRSKRLPAWLSRYRRLNTIFERSKDR